jgi:hypothetical protein
VHDSSVTGDKNPGPLEQGTGALQPELTRPVCHAPIGIGGKCRGHRRIVAAANEHEIEAGTDHPAH